jgi:hypothetical protein
MLAHVVAQIKTVGGGWHVSGCFLFLFSESHDWRFCYSHQVQTTPKAEHSGVLDNSTHFSEH